MQADYLRTNTVGAAPDFKEPQQSGKREARARGPRRPPASAALVTKTSDEELALPKELSKQINQLKSTLSKGEIFAVEPNMPPQNTVAVKAAAVHAVEQNLHSVVSSFLEATFGIGRGACEITFNPGWSTTSKNPSSVHTTFESAVTPDSVTEFSVSSLYMNEEELQALDKKIPGGLCSNDSDVFNESEMPPGPTVLVTS